MKKIHVDFCNSEQTIPENKNWPRGAGSFCWDLIINLSTQCSAFSRVLQIETLKVALFSDPVWAAITNA